MSGSIGNRLDRLERQRGHGSASCRCSQGVRVIEVDELEPESPWLCSYGNRYTEELLIRIIREHTPLSDWTSAHA
jgi:hypothetical protein